MSNQIVPNTESSAVATTAIAWEIIKMSGLRAFLADKYPEDEVAKRLSNAVLEIRIALYNGNKLKVSDSDK